MDDKQDQGLREVASSETATTRRGWLKDQAKFAFVFGAAFLSANAAKAAPRPPCFLRGTKIRTVDGESNVEDLVVGDLIVNALGHARAVQWVGKWHLRKAAGMPWTKEVRPVRIKQSSLGPNLPNADLYVTQGHAVFIEGVLVPAGKLINGTSIVLHAADDTDELEYFHIKLTTHDVIFAAGVTCETLLKYPNPADDNLAGAVPKIDNPADGIYCAPVIYNGNRSSIVEQARRFASPWLGPHKIDVIRARLDEQARRLGC